MIKYSIFRQKYLKYFPDLSKLYELDNFINFITYIYDYN